MTRRRGKREVRVIPFGEVTILPPANPNACGECAVIHTPEEPHNRDSLHYQYVVYQRTGRWPTWRDALAHCPPRIREMWTQLLTERGIKLDG